MSGIDFSERNSFLSSQIAQLALKYSPKAKCGLDIGCQNGELTREIVEKTGIRFLGIEPSLKGVTFRNGIKIYKAWANKLPFNNEVFDIINLAAVFEYFLPERRLECMIEMFHVLKPGGYVVGELPNMDFPIDLHSLLPLQQFLPRRIGAWYFQHFSKVSWKNKGYDWYYVRRKQIHKTSTQAGFKLREIKFFNYPKKTYPVSVRQFYFLLSLFPTSYFFVLEKPSKMVPLKKI